MQPKHESIDKNHCDVIHKSVVIRNKELIRDPLCFSFTKGPTMTLCEDSF